MNKTPKTVERQPVTGQSRRTFLTGSTSLGLILAAGTAPAFIREAGASKLRKVSFMLPWLFVGGHSFEFAAQKIFWKNAKTLLLQQKSGSTQKRTKKKY